MRHKAWKYSFSFVAALLTSLLWSAPLQAQQTYTLQQVREAALEHNFATRDARLGIEQATQQRKEAFTNFFPSVSGTGFWFNANRGMASTDITPSELMPASLIQSLAESPMAESLQALAMPVNITMMKKGLVAGVTAMQPVFAGGQIINGNKLAKVGEQVSQLQLRLSEQEVEKKATGYFWQIITLEEKLNTVNAALDMLAGLCRDVETAVNAGVAMRNDLLQVQLRQNEVESQKVTLQNGIEVLHMVLAQYCGFPSSRFNLSAPTDDISPLSVQQDPDQALAGTAEYQLLDKQVEASKLQQRMEVGKNLPTIAVGAGYNYHNLLDNDRTFAMLFATVSIPISDWWGGSHAIKQKRIATRRAQEQLDDNAQLLKIRMTTAWNAVQEAYLKLTIAERSVSQAEENLRIQRERYQAGTLSMTDLLQAQLLQQQAADSHTDAVATYQNSLLDYRQAVGQ